MASIVKFSACLLVLCLAFCSVSAQFWRYPWFNPYWFPQGQNADGNGDNTVVASTRNPSCPRVTQCTPAIEAYCSVPGSATPGSVCPSGMLCCPFNYDFGYTTVNRPGFSCCVFPRAVNQGGSTGTGTNPGTGINPGTGVNGNVAVNSTG